MTDSQAEYEAWLDAYEMAWQNPAAVPTMTCPSCGGNALHLIFVVDDLNDDSGTAVFWCDSCLRGLGPNQAPIPAGGTKVLRGREKVPNYRTIHDHE